MTDGEILGTLRRLARERLDLERELSEELRLVEDLGLDSLSQQVLAMEVENHFRICLDEEDEEEIRTVGDLVGTIRGKLAATP